MTKPKPNPGRRGLPPSVWECSHVSPPGPHRLARLEAERQRLERRLAWAEKRGEAAKVAHLERRLSELDEALSLPPEALEGSGRAAALRREWGEEMAAALGW